MSLKRNTQSIHFAVPTGPYGVSLREKGREAGHGRPEEHVGSQSSVYSLRPSVFGRRSSVFDLRSSAIGLRSSAVGLQSSAVGLRPSVFGRRSSAVGLRPSVSAVGLRS